MKKQSAGLLEVRAGLNPKLDPKRSARLTVHDVSAQSKKFYKTAKKHNQCCVVM